MATNPKVVSNHTPVEAPDIERESQKNRIGLQFENQPGELPSRLDLPLLVYRRDQRSFAPHHEICPYCKGLGVVDPDEARKKIAVMKPQARPRKRRPKYLSNAPALPV